MNMPGRKFDAGSEYRYGFNGKENDKEAGEGIQDYGMRIYDARLGRFLSVDPLASDFAWNSPYSYAEGDPINFIDLDGLEKPDQSAQANPEQGQRNQLRVIRPEQAKVIPLNGPSRPVFRFRAGLNPFSVYVRNLYAIKTYKDDWWDFTLYQTQQAQANIEVLKLQLQQIRNETALIKEIAVISYEVRMMATTEREEGKERKKDLYLYRGGPYTDANFTPREKDALPGPKQGYSTWVTAIQAVGEEGKGKYQIFSVKKLIKLGFTLNVDVDGHVSILPKSQRALRIWAKTRDAVLKGKSPHLLTKILKKAWVKEDKLIK